ncbi:MAG: isoleucine--tRNA ligase, partial [Clostridiales bacterium]|nr:isoleucine--tRNA ligase [Clostridiales bacterium]
AEEIYRHLPKPADAPASVQLLDLPQVDEACLDDVLEAKWQKVLQARETVSKELESARQNKLIGHSLDAAVTLYAGEETRRLLTGLNADLSKIFIVSQVNLAPAEAARPREAGGTEELGVAVAPAAGAKCERCWIYSESVGQDAEHGQLCARCAGVMEKLSLE